MRWAIQHYRFSKDERLIMELANDLSLEIGRTKCVFPKQADICKQTGLSKSHVSRAMRRLSKILVMVKSGVYSIKPIELWDSKRWRVTFAEVKEHSDWLRDLDPEADFFPEETLNDELLNQQLVAKSATRQELPNQQLVAKLATQELPNQQLVANLATSLPPRSTATTTKESAVIDGVVANLATFESPPPREKERFKERLSVLLQKIKEGGTAHALLMRLFEATQPAAEVWDKFAEQWIELCLEAPGVVEEGLRLLPDRLRRERFPIKSKLGFLKKIISEPGFKPRRPATTTPLPRSDKALSLPEFEVMKKLLSEMRKAAE